MKELALIVLIIALTACSSSETDSGVYKKSETVENKIKATLPWEEVKNEGTDIALRNRSTNSFFLFNSACRRYEASNLSNLTASILTGINDVEYIEKKYVTHQDRDAALVTAKGSIDGIARFLRILTTQKNNCIYDFALISTGQKTLDADSAAFDSFLQLIKLN